MENDRVTETGLEVVGAADAGSRATEIGIEAVQTGVPSTRATTTGLEVVQDGVPSTRLTTTGLEVVGQQTGTVPVRDTQVGMEVAWAPDWVLTLPDAFEYMGGLLAIIPSYGPTKGGTRVRLIGTDFPAGKTITITFDGVPATNIVYVSPSQIRCRTPSGAAGDADVVLTFSESQDQAVLAFTFDGEDPMRFCTANGVDVPPPTAGARIGDDAPPSGKEGGIMVLESGIFGATGVEVAGIVRSQVWPADMSAMTGETLGSLFSIASNRTNRFYGLRHELSPAPSGLPVHAGVLPQPPVPTGITMSVTLAGEAAGAAVLPGFYEYGILLYTTPVYPHHINGPTIDGPGHVFIGPLASITVPTPTELWAVGFNTNYTITFPNPATMSPYFAGSWIVVARKDGGVWYQTQGSPPVSSGAPYFDGVIPYPGYSSYGYGSSPSPGRFIGTASATNVAFGRKVFDLFFDPTVNTSATGPWYDLTLVEFDNAGALTGNEWLLFHRTGNHGPPEAIAVDRDTTVAYYDNYDYDGDPDTPVITKVDLSTLVASIFASEATDYYVGATNTIRVLGNGDVLVAWTTFDDTIIVHRYSSAGVLLMTYPVTTLAWDPELSHGTNDSHFWVSYVPDLDPYLDHLVCFDVLTGNVLHSFDAPWVDDDGYALYETGAPFCVTSMEGTWSISFSLLAGFLYEDEALLNEKAVGLTWAEFTPRGE